MREEKLHFIMSGASRIIAFRDDTPCLVLGALICLEVRQWYLW